MTLDSAARGRYRYVLTRPCLDTGSIAVLRYLEHVLPLEGSIVFVTEGGEELRLTGDPKSRRLYGLGDYYVKHKLSVNDALYMTPLGERRFSLESVTKSRDERPKVAPPPRPAAPPPPQRIILEESPYVREVREVRVSPYPKGIMYPQNGDKANGEKPAEGKDGKAGAVEARDSEQRTPAGTAKRALERLIAQDRKTEAPREEAPAPSEPARRFNRAPLPLSPRERARVTFEALGYTVEQLEGAESGTGFAGGMLLSASLGRRTHRVAAVVLTDGAAEKLPDRVKPTLELGSKSGAKYLAVIAPSKVLEGLDANAIEGTSLARMDSALLERLYTITQLAAIGPLDLEGYWNAGSIGPDALDSLEANAANGLRSRGAFSFVTLSLSKHKAPTVISANDVMAALEGSGINLSAVIETLETLSKTPFMLLSSLGGGEYYLRQDMPAALEGLAEYASSLRQRLRVAEATTPADAALARSE